MRQVLVFVSALALAACGGDGSGEGSSTLSGEAAQTAADRVMLSAEDLGSGWEQTGTAPPQDDDGTDIDDCLSDDVAAASDDPLGESDTHEFARGAEPTNQQQLQVSTIVVEDPDHAAGLVEELADLDGRAAVLRVDLPELLVVVGDRHHPEVQAVAAPDGLHGLERLGEVVAGVDEDHLDRRLHLVRQVDEHGVGHRRRQAQVRVERVDRPPDDLRRRRGLQLGVDLLELLVGEAGQVAGPERDRRVGDGHQVAHSEAPISLTYGPVSPKST